MCLSRGKKACKWLKGAWKESCFIMMRRSSKGISKESDFISSLRSLACSTRCFALKKWQFVHPRDISTPPYTSSISLSGNAPITHSWSQDLLCHCPFLIPFLSEWTISPRALQIPVCISVHFFAFLLHLQIVMPKAMRDLHSVCLSVSLCPASCNKTGSSAIFGASVASETRKIFPQINRF